MNPNFCLCLSDDVGLSLSHHTSYWKIYLKILKAIISEINGYFYFLLYTFLNFIKIFVLKYKI